MAALAPLHPRDPKPMKSLGLRLTLAFLATAFSVAGTMAIAVSVGVAPLRASAFAALAGLVVAPLAARAFWAPIARTLRALEDGIRSCREQDYSVRLRADSEDELGGLLARYNAMADALREGKSDVHARELVLDTLLQRAPMAIVLANANDRIVYANAPAKRLFGGVLLPGRRLADALTRVPQELRDVIGGGEGGLVATASGDEVYRVIHRDVALGTIKNRLVVVEPVTQELRRQEIETWKKVLRVVCHELNNSLAPVSSLLHSARHVVSAKLDLVRQDAILEKVDQRVQHLARFLEGYARFARLPAPRPQEVDLPAFVDSVRGLFPFTVVGEIPEIGFFDASQLQQVLINLLKNAHEAKSQPDEVTLAIEGDGDELRLSVSDRGEGMSEATLRHAIVPFSSSKTGGMGVGLALCNEVVRAHGGRLVLRSRVGEGTTVTCVLPQKR